MPKLNRYPSSPVTGVPTAAVDDIGMRLCELIDHVVFNHDLGPLEAMDLVQELLASTRTAFVEMTDESHWG